MSKKLQKREITDVVDFLLDDIESVEQGDIKQLELDILENYHDHPFTLYKGKRLNDMVESVKENGILNPIIVLKKGDNRYEILSGHNRVNAARQAKLNVIPCIVKENLTDKEAYTYVIETNLMQRSFSDLLPTEKALVLKIRYEKIASQGKRNDLKNEIILSISQKGRVDFDYMQNLTDKTRETLIEELRGEIFLNLDNFDPSDTTPFRSVINNGDFSRSYVTADEYLSGNIRDKIHIIDSYIKNIDYEISKNEEYLAKDSNLENENETENKPQEEIRKENEILKTELSYLGFQKQKLLEVMPKELEASDII